MTLPCSALPRRALPRAWILPPTADGCPHSAGRAPDPRAALRETMRAVAAPRISVDRRGTTLAWRDPAIDDERRRAPRAARPPAYPYRGTWRGSDAPCGRGTGHSDQRLRAAWNDPPGSWWAGYGAATLAAAAVRRRDARSPPHRRR